MAGVDRRTGRMIPNAAAIRQSVETALKTPKGTRVLRGDLGFEALEKDGRAKKGLSIESYRSLAQDALLTFQSDIDLQNVQVEVDNEGTLKQIRIEYVYDGAPDSVVVRY